MRRAVVNFGKSPADSIIPIVTNPSELEVVFSLINILTRGAMDFVGENRGASKVQEIVQNAVSDTRLNQPSRIPDVKSTKRDQVVLPSLPNPGNKPCYFLVIYVFSKCYVFHECLSCFKRHHFR